MARASRRRSTASGGRRRAFRMPKDWVYSTEAYSPAYTLTAGFATAQAIPLVYSQNTTRYIMWGTAAEPAWGNRLQLQSGAAFPDHSKQKVYAADCWLEIAPVTFTAGQEFAFGARLLHNDMDVNTAQMVVQTGYSMWSNTADLDAAQAANAGYLKEMRMSELVPSVAGLVNRGRWMKRFFWSSQRGITLGNDRGLFLFMESLTGSVVLRVRLYCRTLMAAPLGGG